MPQVTGSQKIQLCLLIVTAFSFLSLYNYVHVHCIWGEYLQEDIPGGQKVLGQLQVVVDCLP